MYEFKKQDNHDVSPKKNNNIHLFYFSKASNTKCNIGTVLYLNLQLTTKSFQLSTIYLRINYAL